LTVATIIDPRFKDSIFDEETSKLVRRDLMSDLLELIPKPLVDQNASPGPSSPKKFRFDTSALLKSVIKDKSCGSDNFVIDPSVEHVSYYLD
jgi:hypothetical protein